jgi:hypothetical protein
MTFAFYFKQREHLISLQKLENSFDNQLIVRSMIEGILLLSAAQENEKVAQNWLKQGNIENFKLLTNKKELNLKITEKDEINVLQSLKFVKDRIKKKCLKDIKQTNRETTPEDYENYRPKLKELLGFIKEKEFHVNNIELYNRFSKWQHWNIHSLSELFFYENNQINVVEKNPHWILGFHIAIQCLIENLKICSKFLNKDISQEIASLEKENFTLFGLYDD